MIKRIELDVDVMRFEAEFGPPLTGWALQALVENTSEVRPSVVFTLTDCVGDTRAFSSDTMPWKLVPEEKWVQSVTAGDLVAYLSKKISECLAKTDPGSPRAPKETFTGIPSDFVIADTVHAFVREVRKRMVLKHVQRLMLDWGGEVSESEVVHAWKTAVVSRIHKR